MASVVLNIGKLLQVSLTGDIALAAAVEVFGIAGYAAIKILNNKKYMAAILKPLQNLGGIIKAWRKGSLILEVVAEKEEHRNNIKAGCESQEILKEINKRLEEYEKEFKQEVGRFETIEIVKEEDLHMSQEEWEKAKIQYQNNIKEAIEKGQN